MRGALIVIVASSAALSCGGTTGGSTVDFPAAAAGASDAKGETLTFTNDKGWSVTLTKARLHVGAVYLDQSVPIPGAGNTQCILPGTYAGEVTSGHDVDLLSPALQPFPGTGHGTTGPAAAAQVWLTGGDINAPDDRTPILVLEGTATLANDTRPFSAVITIGQNRTTTSTTPGADPPCGHRIALVNLNPRSPLLVSSSGGLLVRIDPRQLFPGVDFAQLTKTKPKARPEDLTIYLFQDNSDDPPSANLYTNLRLGGSLYSFTWVEQQ